jgi:hypothetical protein
LVLIGPDDENAPSVVEIVDLSDRSTVTITGPVGANINWGGDGVLFSTTDPDTEEEIAWLVPVGETEPKLLPGCGSWVEYDSKLQLAACVRRYSGGQELLLFDVSQETLVPRVLLAEPIVGADLYVGGFSPDGEGLLASRSFVTDELVSNLLWFSKATEFAGPPVQIDRGRFTRAESWQPAP